MADETILEQAVAMIPGMGKPKRGGRRKSTHETYLSTIQKNLAELARAVEKLGSMVTGNAAPKSTAKRAKPRKAMAKRTTSGARKRATPKRPAASARTRRTKRK